jgi:hypothetical protein
MKFKYNTRLALIALAICFVGSILIGGGASLERYRDTQAALFEIGTTGDGNSIRNDLDVRCTAAYNLITLGKRYMPANAGELTALADAITKLETAATVTECFDANYELTLAADHLYGTLLSYELSDTDRRLLSGQFTEMASRNQTIGHDGYNEAAMQFNALLSRFPTNLIVALNGVSPLELFR